MLIVKHTRHVDDDQMDEIFIHMMDCLQAIFAQFLPFPFLNSCLHFQLLHNLFYKFFSLSLPSNLHATR